MCVLHGCHAIAFLAEVATMNHPNPRNALEEVSQSVLLLQLEQRGQQRRLLQRQQEERRLERAAGLLEAVLRRRRPPLPTIAHFSAM